MKKISDFALLISVSLALAFATYVSDLWLLSLSPLAGLLKSSIKTTDALFIEGLLFLIAGISFLIGSGGISRISQSAALLASAAKAADGDVIGPSEVFRRDAWRSRGFTRLGLVLIITAIILLVVSFIPT